MELNGKTVLVTGGTGLVGRSVISLLVKNGAKIVCLTRRSGLQNTKQVTYIPCDLLSITTDEIHQVEKATSSSIDTIIYLAASIPQRFEKETMVEAKRNTLDAFLYFLEAFGHLSQKIILTSTIDIYGYPEKENFDENTEVKPETPYAIAKYACEEYVKYFAHINDKAYVILRLSQVYGPNEPLVRVIPFILDAAFNGTPFTLSGSGNDKRRYVYSDDVARALLLAVFHNSNDIFHIAGNEEISINDVVRVIEETSGKKIAVTKTNPDKKVVNILPDFSKAKNKLRYEPQVTFEQGIKEVVSEKQKATKLLQ